MASEWFYKVFDQELGPLNFEELVALVRAGTMTEEDLVRREGTDVWQPARAVIGLFRAATMTAEDLSSALDFQRPTEEEEEEELSEPEPSEPPQQIRSTWLTHPWILCFCIVFVAAAGYWFWSWRREAIRFPKPRALREQALEGYYLFGTGPWMLLEYILLWLDLIVVVGSVLYFGRRFIQRCFATNKSQ